MNWRAILWPARYETVRLLAIMSAGSDREALLRIAGRQHWQVDLAPNTDYALDLLGAHRFAVIVYDCDTAGPNWRAVLDQLVKHSAGASVILASPTKDDHLWQEVTQRGGYDVVLKPFREDLVTRSIRFAGRGSAG